jgi:geranylgeranyl transferase type-2 subunit beta
MADVFHTFFGIAGLSLLGHLHSAGQEHYREIDPVYALPTDVVRRLGLSAQVVTRKGQQIDDRLKGYDVYSF